MSGCSRVLLDERFHDNRLLGWTAIDDPDTIEGPSRWEVRDGWVHQRGNLWGRRGDFIGRWYGSFLVTGDSRWRDYTLSVRIRADDDDGFGIVFRFQDPEHFYRLILVNDGMNGGPVTRLDKREGADYTELWSAPAGFKIHKEMSIVIAAVKDEIKATLDDRILFEVKDGSYAHGKVGLFCYAQSDQAFDDVRVIGR
jgi:hypothetical protein